MKTRSQVVPALLIAILLSLGLSVYLYDRPADRVYFIPDGWQTGTYSGELFGSLGAHLPSFVHVAVFILITAAILAPWRFRLASICLFWFGLDSLFELAQHDAIAVHIAAIVPDWFQQVTLLENTVGYFLAGTFDLLDILSIALGSMAAYLVLLGGRVLERRNDGIR
jgi:hypothetical protein